MKGLLAVSLLSLIGVIHRPLEKQSDNLVQRQTRLLSFPQGITDDTFRNITTSPLGACLPLLRMESSTCGSSSPFRESLTHTNPRTPRAHGYMHAGNNITISSPACPKWQPDSSKKQKTSHTPQRRCAFCLFEHYYLFANHSHLQRRDQKSDPLSDYD